MGTFVLSFFSGMALAAFVVNYICVKKHNKVPWLYLIIQLFIMGIVAGVGMFFSDSAIAIAYMIVIMLLSFMMAVYFILMMKTYKKIIKNLKETEALHKKIAEEMAENAIKEIEEVMNKE